MPPASEAAPDTAGVKRAAEHVVQSRRAALVELSHDVHAHPEVCFEETYSSARVAGSLAEGGFEVELAVGDLPTAFSARIGSGPLVIALCAEYDALPGIGHACGHNIIAASAVGAGLALAPVVDDLGMSVVVLGTPAEEGGGGKILMLDRGVFDGVHAAMMVHPWSIERLRATCLAVAHFDVHYRGRTAHASAAPWEGVNAADGLTIAQVALGLLRQQLHPGDQIHGVTRHGGRAANVIPDDAHARYMCRARDLEALAVLRPRVERCFEAGALASGATVSIDDLAPVYSHLENDPELLDLYRANAEHLGREFSLDDQGTPSPTLSTDMANVSLALPTIHPLMAIDAAGAVNHQPEFAAACVTASADAALCDAALAMAWTAIDAASSPLRQRLLAAAGGTQPGR
jgi:amidohydrolase